MDPRVLISLTHLPKNPRMRLSKSRSRYPRPRLSLVDGESEWPPSSKTQRRRFQLRNNRPRVSLHHGQAVKSNGGLLSGRTGLPYLSISPLPTHLLQCRSLHPPPPLRCPIVMLQSIWRHLALPLELNPHHSLSRRHLRKNWMPSSGTILIHSSSNMVSNPSQFLQSSVLTELGPFVATQMHDWYSQSYFEDALPVRRESETSFYPLGELKMTTGNPVRPFVSAPRPPPPPPSVPEHQNMARQQSIPPPLEPFRDLAIGQQFSPDPRFNPNTRMPMQQFPQQPFRNEPGFPSNQFPPQQGQGFPQPFQSPGFVNAAPGPQWGTMAPHQGLPSRLNGTDAFGSPGMPSPIRAMPGPFPPQNAFSPSINQTLNRAPDFFSPSHGVGSIPASPWGAPSHPHGSHSHQPQQPFQEQSQHQQPQTSGPWQLASPMQPMSQSQSIDQPSYFPSDGQETSAPIESNQDQSVHESESQIDEAVAEDPAISSQQQPEPSSQDAEVSTPVEKPTTGPPASAWAPVPAVSRKSSVAADPLPSSVTDTTEPQTASKLAPAPASASLPSKPVAARKPSVSENMPSTPAETATSDKAAAPKPAPWASDKEAKTPSGPSLREIQQAESKVAEARKQALADARANNAVPSPALSTNEDMPTSMSWGLPAQNSKAPQVATPSATASPSTPVWGSGEAAAPKKTLKQIQEEEKKRSVKLAQAKAQAQGITASPASASTPAAKRGYADLAATTAPPGAGWQTVGASGKGAPGAASPAPGSRVASVAKPAAASTPTKAAPAPVSRVVQPTVNDSTPSVELIRWTKQALTGLNINSKYFSMLITRNTGLMTSSRRFHTNAPHLPS